MKKLKIVFLFLLFSGFAACGPVIAQSLTSGVWRMQNPDNMNESRLLMFSSDGWFTYSVCDLSSGQTSFRKGRYELSSGRLAMHFNDGSEFDGRLDWINDYKISVNTNGSPTPSYFAIIGTAEDNFMSSRLDYQNGNTYNNAATHEHKACYACFGTGRCRVCGGTGIYSFLSSSSTCSACNGTGKCWACRGTGRRE